MKEKEIINLVYNALGAEQPSRGVLAKAQAEMDKGRLDNQFKKAAKSKNEFQKLFLSSRRGMAAFAACIFLFVTVVVAIPVIYIGGGLDMTRTLSLLRNTKVDMTDVNALGIAEVGADGLDFSGRAGVGVNKERVRSVQRMSEGESNPDAEQDDWESDYDPDPDKAQLLVKVDENGAVEEVVYERVNGRGIVRQDKLGHVVGLYVGTEFTYVMYAKSLPDWYLVQDIIHGGADFFGSHHEEWQTIIIHNATGTVYPLKDLIPIMSEFVGAKQYTLWAKPFDSVLDVHVLYNRRDASGREIFSDPPSVHFRLRVDEAQKLVFENITQSEQIRNAKQDVYGNLYLLTRNLSKIEGEMFFFTQDSPLYFGADRRVYLLTDDCLQVYNAEFELENVSADYETTLEEIWPIIDGHNSHIFENGMSEPIASLGNNPGAVYVLENGYLFSMYGKVLRLGEQGQLSFVKQLEGDFPAIGEDGYILDGELVAQVMQGDESKIVHIDFTEFSESDTHAVVTEIVTGELVSCNGIYMVCSQPTEAKYGGRKFFIIKAEDGVFIVEWIAYRDEQSSIMPVKPIMEAWPVYSR